MHIYSVTVRDLNLIIFTRMYIYTDFLIYTKENQINCLHHALVTYVYIDTNTHTKENQITAFIAHL